MHKPKAKPSILEEIRKYILSNLFLSLWNLSLLIGGVIFWMYFFHIQYFPDLRLDESVLLLLLVAITGFFLLFVMASIFMIPYFFRWLMLLADKQKEKKNVGELIWYFVSIFLAFLAIVLFYLEDDKSHFYTSYPILLWFIEHTECVGWILILIIFVGHIKCYLWNLILPIWGFIKAIVKLENPFKKSDKKTTNEKNDPKGGKEHLFIAWFFSVILSIILPLSIFDQTAQIESKELSVQITLSVIFFLSLLVLNGIFAYFRDHEKKWWVWGIPFVIVIVLSYFARDPLIPKMVMKRFHLGNFTAEQFTVNGEGCETLKNLGIEPKPDTGEKIEHSKRCNFEKIIILSRLGGDFRLKKEIDNKILNFNIPKKNVLFWSIVRPKDKP